MVWLCRNCTACNPDHLVACDTCNEHKESGISRRGHFADPHTPDSGISPGYHDAFLTRVRQVQGFTIVDTGFPSPPAVRSTLIGFDERMLLHKEMDIADARFHLHPERPDRLRAIIASLAAAHILPGRCHLIKAEEISVQELLEVHSAFHLTTVEIATLLYSCYFTRETYANKHSAHAARLAAGLCSDLAVEIVTGRARNAFALVRPPGHLAGVDEVMGYCLFNNAAIAAVAAQSAGAEKVLIVDWDVNHGEGTQRIFETNKSVLYISLHRHGGGAFSSGEGAASKVGTMDGEGYSVNIPWRHTHVGDNDYIFAFQHVVRPIASEYAPDFTIISAGFNAARGDNYGLCDVTPDGYAQMTHMLNTISNGKLLVILEGGYNLRSTSHSATAVVKVLLGESPGTDFTNCEPSNSGLQDVLEVLKIQMNYWPTLRSIYSKLQSPRRLYKFKNKRKQSRKSRRAVIPLFSRWGKKRWLLHLLVSRPRVKSKRC